MFQRAQASSGFSWAVRGRQRANARTNVTQRCIRFLLLYDWTMRVIVAALLAFVCLPLNAAWLKGNLHTHTLESDGDSTPADVVRWYAEHGYDFLAITDHDKITRVEDSRGLVLILAEEVTDRLPKKPLHVNAIGIETPVK